MSFYLQKTDHYLHYHHRSVKEASVGYFAPILRQDLGLSEDVINMSQKSFNNALKALDSLWLKNNKYIAGENISIADFSAYVEIAQLNKQFTNLFDYSSFENLSRWLNSMSKVPFHDDVHMVLNKKGDISQKEPAKELSLIHIRR